MKSIKIIISFLTILFLFSQNSFAQKELKYKDIYEFVSKPDTILTYEKMKEFQQQDPFHANSYYQLGLIAQVWSKKYDPLTQAADVRYFVYHTNVYLGLAKKYLDDKEVRKNKEFYQDVVLEEGEKLSLKMLDSIINLRLVKNKEFSVNFEKTYLNFTKSVNFYNNCVKLFLEINKNNTKEKELLMTANDELMNKIKELEISYDSTIYYLEALEANLQEYPIKNYKQQHKIKTIETYRLEGLTYTNFLENDISLWNFKEWANNFNSLLGSDINNIRTKIDSTHKSLNVLSSEFRTSKTYSDSNATVKINPKILFRIGKYDYNSVLVDFLNYEESKANYLRFSKKTANNTSENALIDLKKKAYYYNKLLNRKQYSDSLAQIAEKNITPRSTLKYHNFISTNYKNVDGFKAHIKKQESDNTDVFKKSLENYKHFMYQESKQNERDTVLAYGKYSISLKINNKKQNIDVNETITESISFNENGEIYISGKVNVSNKEKAFVALVTDNKVKWFKTQVNKLATSNTSLFVQANSDGCFLIVSSIEENTCKNKLIRMNKAGRKTQEKELLENKVPRYMNYDDINEKILIAYYGTTKEAYSNILSELLISNYNTELKISSLWQQAAEIKLIGNFIDIAQINENIYVFSNFNEYQNINSQSMSVPEKSSSYQLNTLLTVINKEGTIVKMLPFLSNNYYYLTKIIKVDNNLINLIGIKGEAKKAKSQIENKKGELHYMLLNGNGELTYSN